MKCLIFGPPAVPGEAAYALLSPFKLAVDFGGADPLAGSEPTRCRAWGLQMCGCGVDDRSQIGEGWGICCSGMTAGDLETERDECGRAWSESSVKRNQGPSSAHRARGRRSRNRV